jgi:hypothetical protein
MNPRIGLRELCPACISHLPLSSSNQLSEDCCGGLLVALALLTVSTGLAAQQIAPIQNWSTDGTANGQFSSGQQYGYRQQPQYDKAPYPQPQYGQPQAPPPQYPQSYPQQGNPEEAYADPNQSYPQYQPNRALNPDQLEQLVAPIALYPDNLVSIVLAGSTYPAQVVAATQWLRTQGNAPPEQIAAGANAQTSWDPSVKALTAFPQVLEQLASNLQWTTDLGNAYYNQPQDVMQTIQVMRSRAQAAGNLQSTPQEQVTMDQGNIVLAPPSPQVVYVPTYNPWVVYGAPVVAYPGYSDAPFALDVIGSTMQFGLGIAMQAFAVRPFGWLGWGLDWIDHAVTFDHGAYCTHSASVHDWGFRYGGPRAFRGGYEAARDGRGWGQGYTHPQPEFRRGGERPFRGQSGRFGNGSNYGQQAYNHGPQPTGRPQQFGGKAFQGGSQGYVGRQQQVGRAYGFGDRQNYAQNGGGYGFYGRGSQGYVPHGGWFSNPTYRAPTPAFGGSRPYGGTGNAFAGSRPYGGYGSAYGGSGSIGRSNGLPGLGHGSYPTHGFNGGNHGFAGFSSSGHVPKSFGGGHSSWGGFGGGGGFKAPNASHFGGGGGGGHFGGGGGHSGGGGGRGHHH